MHFSVPFCKRPRPQTMAAPEGTGVLLNRIRPSDFLGCTGGEAQAFSLLPCHGTGNGYRKRWSFFIAGSENAYLEFLQTRDRLLRGAAG